MILGIFGLFRFGGASAIHRQMSTPLGRGGYMPTILRLRPQGGYPFDDASTTHPSAVKKFPVGNPYRKKFFSFKSFSMTRKWFLMMRNMFLGSEMMFDMIRNYFGVEKNDLIFRSLRGRLTTF